MRTQYYFICAVYFQDVEHFLHKPTSISRSFWQTVPFQLSSFCRRNLVLKAAGSGPQPPLVVNTFFIFALSLLQSGSVFISVNF